MLIITWFHSYISVKEDVAPGTQVIKLEVYDYDRKYARAPGTEGSFQADNKDVQMFITSGNEAGHFDVTPTLNVIVSHKLDRETVPQYNLIVTATDGVFITTCSLTIQVLDVNGKLILALSLLNFSFLKKTT